MKSLRRILKIPPTFLDRSYPPIQEWWRFFQTPIIRLFSFGWIAQMTRCDKSCLNIILSFHVSNKKKTGPRTDWLLQSFKDAFTLLGRADEFDSNNLEHIQFIVQHANARQGVFAWMLASLAGFSWLFFIFVTECRHRMSSPFTAIPRLIGWNHNGDSSHLYTVLVRWMKIHALMFCFNWFIYCLLSIPSTALSACDLTPGRPSRV